MLCSEENMELLQVEMSHKEKENTRLKEEIEEQKRSRLETERELKEEITELQEELARLDYIKDLEKRWKTSLKSGINMQLSLELCNKKRGKD